MRLPSKLVKGALLPLAFAAVSASAASIHTGFYAGLNTGASFLNNTSKTVYNLSADNEALGITMREDSSQRGFNGGIFSGYNFYNDGTMMVGAELSFDWNSNNGYYADDYIVTNNESTYSMRYDFNLTIQPGVCITPCAWMFMKLGVAYGCFCDDYENLHSGLVSGAKVVNTDEGLFGWTLGAGLQRAVTDNFSLFTSYQYTYYGTCDMNVAKNGTRINVMTAPAAGNILEQEGAISAKIKRDAKLDQSVFKIGAIYTF